MNSTTRELVENWFSGLNAGNRNDLLSLFSPRVSIRNAANPELSGPGAAAKLIDDFLDRTKARQFNIVDYASNGRDVFVCWTGLLTFRAGLTIGDTLLLQDMDVPLRGVERFVLDNDGLIERLFIVHETTSVMATARKLFSTQEAAA